MATKAAFLAAFLLVLVAGDLAHGHTVPPLRRGTRSHDWMQGKKGGPPSGIQPSDAAAAHLRAISSMQKGRGLCIIALIIFGWYSKMGHIKRSKQRKPNRTFPSFLAWRKASSSRLCRDSSSRRFLRTLHEKRSHHRASMHAMALTVTS
uniref:Uncharacterized protein n=1 Tax=Hordeum vulgare subsp. vulgare TaxID=112509 RepID=A0A8I7BHR9_HORVV